jgi:hypothetical protein
MHAYRPQGRCLRVQVLLRQCVYFCTSRTRGNSVPGGERAHRISEHAGHTCNTCNTCNTCMRIRRVPCECERTGYLRVPVCVCPPRSQISGTLADIRYLCCVTGTLTYPYAHAHRISERAGHTRATYAHAGVVVLQVLQCCRCCRCCRRQHPPSAGACACVRRLRAPFFIDFFLINFLRH